MMKDEFMQHLREYNPNAEEISAEDYAIVEFVYTWHPAIPNYGGKDTIAHLYHLCGIGLISDMMNTARKEEQKDAERCRIRRDISVYQEAIARLEEQLASL